MSNIERRIRRANERANEKQKENLTKQRTAESTVIAKEFFKVLAKHSNDMVFAEDFAQKRDYMNAICNTMAGEVLDVMRDKNFKIFYMNFLFQCMDQVVQEVKDKIQGGVGESMDYVVAKAIGAEDTMSITVAHVEDKLKEYKSNEEIAAAEAEEETATAEEASSMTAAGEGMVGAPGADVTAPVDETEPAPGAVEKTGVDEDTDGVLD